MKNILKLLCFVVAVGLLSCDKDNEAKIIDKSLMTGVGFPQTSNSFEVKPSETPSTVEVTIGRADKSKAATYNVTLTNESGITVSAPATVAFAAGEGSVLYPIAVTTGDMAADGSTYTFRLTIDVDNAFYDESKYYNEETNKDGYKNPYMGISNTMTVTVGLELNWIDVGLGLYTFSTPFGGDDEILLQHAEGTNNYRLKDLVVEGVHILFSEASDGTLTIPTQATGYMNGADGMIYIRTVGDASLSYKSGNMYYFNTQYYDGGGAWAAAIATFELY